MLEVANKTINELKAQLKMPIDPQLAEEKDEVDPKDLQINQLKAEIESNKNKSRKEISRWKRE